MKLFPLVYAKTCIIKKLDDMTKTSMKKTIQMNENDFKTYFIQTKHFESTQKITCFFFNGWMMYELLQNISITFGDSCALRITIRKNSLWAVVIVSNNSSTFLIILTSDILFCFSLLIISFFTSSDFLRKRISSYNSFSFGVNSETFPMIRLRLAFRIILGVSPPKFSTTTSGVTSWCCIRTTSESETFDVSGVSDICSGVKKGVEICLGLVYLTGVLNPSDRGSKGVVICIGVACVSGVLNPSDWGSQDVVICIEVACVSGVLNPSDRGRQGVVICVGVANLSGVLNPSDRGSSGDEICIGVAN